MVVTLFGYIIILVQFKIQYFAQSNFMQNINSSELKAYTA